MEHTGDPLETLNALLDDGWKVTEVTSDDTAVRIALVRGPLERTVLIDRHHARRLLTGGLETLGPVHA